MGLKQFNFFSLIPAFYCNLTISTSMQEWICLIRPNFLFLCTWYLKHSSLIRISSLVDIVIVDRPWDSLRFTANYLFLNVLYSQRLIIKTFVSLDRPFLDSLCPIIFGALWFERQVYDMFGLFFQNNPDLRRILTDYGFQGYPLRKDFPLSGYLELRYDDVVGSVVYEPVELMQEFRSFAVLGPWHVSNQ